MRRNSILIPLSFLRILFFRSDAPAASQSQPCYCSQWSEFRISPFRDRDDPSLSLRFTSLAPASLLCPDHTLVPRIDTVIESCSQKMDRISHLWGQKDEPCYHCIYIFPPRVLFGIVYARVERRVILENIWTIFRSARSSPLDPPCLLFLSLLSYRILAFFLIVPSLLEFLTEISSRRGILIFFRRQYYKVTGKDHEMSNIRLFIIRMKSYISAKATFLQDCSRIWININICWFVLFGQLLCELCLLARWRVIFFK